MTLLTLLALVALAMGWHWDASGRRRLADECCALANGWSWGSTHSGAASARTALEAPAVLG